MNKLIWPLALAFLVVVAVIGAVLVFHPASPPAAGPASGKGAATRRATPVPASPAPTLTSTATTPAVVPPNVPGPWAVLSAYYRAVNSHHYRQAWSLISAGAVTGQTYQQFVAGYACTGTVHVIKVSQAGDQVRFRLVAADGCTGQTLYYTGIDTVHHGKIVAADVKPGR